MHLITYSRSCVRDASKRCAHMPPRHCRPLILRCPHPRSLPPRRPQYGMVHISVGDLLREEVKNGTAAGKRAKDFMDAGALVPDEVVVTMVKNRMAQADVQQNGWLLDGYPRSASQAEAIIKEGIHPDVFILINVPDELLVERVVGRRLDPVTGDIYHLKCATPPARETDEMRRKRGCCR